jgi:hypothetical protein
MQFYILPRAIRSEGNKQDMYIILFRNYSHFSLIDGLSEFMNRKTIQYSFVSEKLRVRKLLLAFAYAS